MKKFLFAIFAHPDDEAFGPSGTLILESQAGAELHLITLTNGEHGQNPDNIENLGEARLEEWYRAASLIGAQTTHHLGYVDSQLSNSLLPKIQQRLIDIIRETTTGTQGKYEIEIMTTDDNGITGHIDHTVASRAATFAFYTLKGDGHPLTRIRYACISREQLSSHTIDWIYMPAGRAPEEIDETIDARQVVETVREVVRCHHTQRHDGQTHLDTRGDAIAINHFLVRS